MAVLDTTKKQLSGTQAELSVQTQNLEAALGNVSILKQNLTEHKILIDAHSTTEASLHSLHSGLVGFTERAVSDNYGLHAKLERKSAVEISNMRVFNDFQNGILREMSTLESGLGMYKTVSEQFTTQILEKLREFHQLQVQNCQTTRTTAADALHSISDALVDLKRVQAEANAGYADDMVSVLGRVESMVARLEEEQETKQMEVVQSLESVAASLTKHSEMTREWHKGMGNSFSELMNAVKANTSTHTASYESMYKTCIESMQNEIQSLRSLNEALEQRAACQKTVQNDAQAKLLSAISQLVGTYTAETESRNDELVKSVVDGMNEAIERNEDVSANVEKIRQVDMASRESAEMAIVKPKCCSCCMYQGWFSGFRISIWNHRISYF
ncbi:hypothetical protein BDR26DRAFT_118160 [Obelidium mucronatum]|nr:hypothetical protein BDR26DRAFT_118160 [Obelidium mucronatum]